MQVPVEAAALLGPVEGQPGPPVECLARPAQVQAGEAEEDQRQGAGGGELLADVADRQPAVQLQDEMEEALTARLAEQLAGVRIEVARRPAALARRRGQESPRRVVVTTIDPQPGDPVMGGGLDLRHQLGRRQHALLAYLHAQDVRVERAHDLAFEGVERAGHAHDGEHQAGTDAEEPVQLEEGFLEHVASLLRWSRWRTEAGTGIGTRKHSI
ncbi:hypothetical protein D9M69_291810 [compost metagenome]